jgi:hypothetical protein
MNESVLRFPQDRSIGKLSIRKSKSQREWTEHAPARGEIAIPRGVEVLLAIDPCVEFDPALFSDFEPEALAVFEWVSTSRVFDAAIKHLRQLTGLKGLALWETDIGDEALRSIGHLYNLEWLDIGDTEITDQGLAWIRELCSLDYLTLLNDRVTDDCLVHLQRLPKLRGLDLMNTLVDDDGVAALSSLYRLRSLRIVGTQITEKGFKELKRALPHCQIRYHHPQHV